MKALEPCKGVVFGGIKEFRLKLKSLGIDKIVNDDESIKESDVVLILIEKIDEKLVATRLTDISVFNNLDLKMVIESEIKDIASIPTIQSIEDFKFDTNKIYYVKSFDSEDGEYWLFEPREEKQEKLTAHVKCLSVLDDKVDYDDDTPGTVMGNSEICELREATPEETRIYRDFWDLYKYRND
jgi:hypothetical protein